MTRGHEQTTIVSVIKIALLFGFQLCIQHNSDAFTPTAFLPNHISADCCKFTSNRSIYNRHTSLYAGGEDVIDPIARNDDDEDEDDEEDDDEDDDEESLYEQFAASEFSTDSDSSELTTSLSPEGIDWGGEYDTLRERTADSLSGRVGPPLALFRTMTTKNPNEAIKDFVSTADPQLVDAMGGAVSSLLGGLANPAAGVETIVKANGEKLGNLCFQLQMTGYMFRNAEYVLAIKDVMDIRRGATLEDYRNAFDRFDTDQSGYIEAKEVEALLSDVYDGTTPNFEIDTFVEFFDSNEDGRISWEEFEMGLGAVASAQSRADNNAPAALPGSTSEDYDEDDVLLEPSISGKVQIELKNGKVIEVEAGEYIEQLKKEAEALTKALQQEKGRFQPQQQSPVPGMTSPGESSKNQLDGIAGYISSLEGDFKSLTEGISSDVVEAMKLLVNYVLDNGNKGPNAKNDKERMEKEMEIPGSALQQLALWQLVVGYKLREAEATGDYRKMLEE